MLGAPAGGWRRHRLFARNSGVLGGFPPAAFLQADSARNAAPTKNNRAGPPLRGTVGAMGVFSDSTALRPRRPRRSTRSNVTGPGAAKCGRLRPQSARGSRVTCGPDGGAPEQKAALCDVRKGPFGKAPHVAELLRGRTHNDPFCFGAGDGGRQAGASKGHDNRLCGWRDLCPARYHCA